MILIADNISYHCEIHSNDPEKPWLLMLHGFLGTGRSFSHLTEQFQTFCNPVTIDLAGHGKTVTPPDPSFYFAERQREQLVSILRRLSLKPLYIYGYSMGGRLAFQLLKTNSRLFKGAIIESSHCGIRSDQERNSRIDIDRARAADIRTHYREFVTNWMDMPMFLKSSMEQDSPYFNSMFQQNPENMACSLLGFGAGGMPPVCSSLSELSIPMLLIAGELDKTYREKMVAISRLNKNFKFETVKGAAHRVHYDQPDILLNVIYRFISGTGRSAVP